MRLVWHYLPFAPEYSDSLQVLSARRQMRMELMWKAFHAFVEKMRELLHAFAEAERHPCGGAPEDFADVGGQRRGDGLGHARDTPGIRLAPPRVEGTAVARHPPPGRPVGPFIHTRLFIHPAVSYVNAIRRPQNPRPIHSPSTVDCG